MNTLWKEVKQIMHQIQGSQNIFGYNSTAANQMYLFYCLSGKIFFTSKMNIRIKHLWYIFTFVEMAALYIFALVYLLFEKEYNNMMILNSTNLVGCTNMTSLGFPLIITIFANKIEAMIEHIDLILTRPRGDDQLANSEQNEMIVNKKKTFVLLMGPFVVGGLIFMFSSFFDVVLFFSEDKVKNNFYYMASVPRIEELGTFGSFLCLNGISTFAFGMILFKSVSFLCLVFHWTVESCGVLIDIRNEIDNRSRNLLEKMEKEPDTKRNDDEWIRNFDEIVQHATDRFQEIILLINHMRPLLEVIATSFTPMGFFYGMAVIYICLSADLPFILKLKCLGMYAVTISGIFQLYWGGEKLNHSVAEISLAIYSTPWYFSSKVRKNVHLLLWQTQTMKELKLMKVYGLMLRNFSRYVQSMFSYANILRRLTMK